MVDEDLTMTAEKEVGQLIHLLNVDTSLASDAASSWIGASELSEERTCHVCSSFTRTLAVCITSSS